MPNRKYADFQKNVSSLMLSSAEEGGVESEAVERGNFVADNVNRARDRLRTTLRGRDRIGEICERKVEFTRGLQSRCL